MRTYFDTEFMEDGKTIDLLSIGMVREDGATYYAELAEADWSKANPWVRENVLPHMVGGVVLKPREQIAAEIVNFVGPHPEFWAYFGSYDWVVLCQLFGSMIDLPQGWPMFVRDLKQLAGQLGIEIEQPDLRHNALDDALWLKSAHETLIEHPGRYIKAAHCSRLCHTMDGVYHVAPCC